MAKFNMKDYDNYMKEETRQDRLQEKLESKREHELLSCGDEYDWLRYQREQEKMQQEDAECEDLSFYYDIPEPFDMLEDDFVPDEWGFDEDDFDDHIPLDDTLESK